MYRMTSKEEHVQIKDTLANPAKCSIQQWPGQRSRIKLPASSPQLRIGQFPESFLVQAHEFCSPPEERIRLGGLRLQTPNLCFLYRLLRGKAGYLLSLVTRHFVENKPPQHRSMPDTKT